MAKKNVWGITGTMGSGKSTLAQFMTEWGAANIEVDQIGHQMLEVPAVVTRLVAAFGPDIRLSEGGVDRKRLGKLAFASPESMATLNAIMHPPMIDEVERRIAIETVKGTPLIALNAALLYRMHLDTFCERIIYVRAAADIRLDRLITIRGVPVDVARARLMAQDPEPPESDQVLFCTNDGSLNDLQRWVGELLARRGLKRSISSTS